MSVLIDEKDLNKLHELYLLRERQALEAIAEQRAELDRVAIRLDEQLSLISGLRRDLADLHALRSGSNIEKLTTQSLQTESDRRRWLIYDLEQEVFYLPGFESDVEEARCELAVRQRTWGKARERINVLEKHRAKSANRIARMEIRREDDLQDDRRVTGASVYG